MNKVTKVWTAYQNGIKCPLTAMRVCDEQSFPYYVLCAFLEQESYGGKNVFGHDGGPSGWASGWGRVTKAKYLKYREGRRAGRGMQGVGPMQLTWWEFQDRADKLGGCWKPYHNITVGVQLLKQYRNGGKNSWEYVGTRYNGSAEYGKQIAARVEKWKNLLS